MLDVQTFGPQGGNVLYKALAHPLAVGPILELLAEIKDKRVAVYDPEGYLPTFQGLYPEFRPSFYLTHDSEQVGLPDGLKASPDSGATSRNGQKTALVDVGSLDIDAVVALSFEEGKMSARLQPLLDGVLLHTLGKARLPEKFLKRGRPYLDRHNFATNFAFFRDDGVFSTRLVTANYWSNYGTERPLYWFLLFDEAGRELARWETRAENPASGVIVDSAEIRQRFNLAPFTGQLFIHVLGAAGHDVVKYALDTFGRYGNPSLSVTHDANAWPARRYGSLPAPDQDEQMTVWVQNSHGTPIPAGSLSFNRMGTEEGAAVAEEIPPYATLAVDVGALLPEVRWPAQLEMRAGRHVVRPRYEITQQGRTRIAHLNVEREDLKPDPAIARMPASLGRGILLPFPVPDPRHFEIWLQPNPMTETVRNLPVRVDLYDEEGRQTASHFLGNLPRDFQQAVPLHELAESQGHGDLVYDFRDGGTADGWLHGMLRYRHRTNRHTAETSFGGHIFNTLMTWRNEPQSYAGPPPGLTTRIFLKLGQKLEGKFLRSFCHLLYPASLEGAPDSQTRLYLYGRDGKALAQRDLSLPACGSRLLHPHKLFTPQELTEAGEGGYVLIRDLTCRLFGYHGLENDEGAFSLDHMFGF
ncbi:hypothetical protein E3E11_08025 [Oecophyllibacter saccharovorans]|uniref:hypothetical protein n=1 Tax=Oecophyllibacter saccharovorans TaxID=2558360 RepID=UPI0011421847|nr:hypothetical protein [Oecophyllibacter saccharovorans]QDH15807.1 hypothetical protein E3E11_08025 [Oecophyllibacter saccharovorans]